MKNSLRDTPPRPNRSASIIGTGSYVPERVMTNADLEAMVETNHQWIVERTGIYERRIAAENEFTSHMAAKAAQAAMENAGVTPEEIDMILVATITPDMFFPSTACQVQRHIGAKNATCMDVNAACSGFLYCVEIANQFISNHGCETVLVIGAGEMAEETLTYLQSEGVKRIVVANRNRERAERLAAKFKGEAVDFSTLDEWLAKADVIVSTTGASQTLITKERFAAARARSQRHPVFILDLAAPRDFDPAAGTVDDNVFLYDLDALEETCSRNRAAREAEVEKARGIIAAQTRTFMQEIYHRATGPVIHRLREHWTDISRSELDRLYRKLPTLESAQRQAIEATIQRIVNKLLHPPLEALKDEAKEGTPEGLLHAIRRLFFFRSE